jgi:hypothetical protein
VDARSVDAPSVGVTVDNAALDNTASAVASQCRRAAIRDRSRRSREARQGGQPVSAAQAPDIEMARLGEVATLQDGPGRPPS